MSYTISPALRFHAHPVCVATLLFLLQLAGCGDSSKTPAPVPDSWETYQSDLARNLAPDASLDEISELVDGQGGFACDLYQRVAGKPGNVLLSPFSIHIAFAMTYGGARGETETEMAQTLRYTLPQAHLHPAFNALDLELKERNDPGDGAQNEPVELHVVNSFWGRIGEPFLPEYLDLLALNYGSGLRGLDFFHQPEESRLVINNWVAGETRNRIRNLLPQRSIKNSTVCVLVNAIYLKAPWAKPFEPDSTADEPFTRLDGSTVAAPTMRQLEHFYYAEGDGYQVLEMSYRLNQLAMVLILPAPGRFEEIEAGLGWDVLEEMLEALKVNGIIVRVPKFSFESTFTLAEPLQAMGMRLAFSGAADFTGIRQDGGLFIDEAFHKTFIDVDEKGTEAAAATAVVVGETSVIVPEHTFAADRPFLFLIRDRVTGAVLFLGRVLDPTA